MPYFWQRSRILSWRTLSISFRIQPPIASLYFPFEDSCALSVDSVHRALIYTDALVPMQNQQARRVGAPPVEEFLVSDGSRAVSRIVDSPEFFEFILRANRSESELMSCVGLHEAEAFGWSVLGIYAPDPVRQSHIALGFHLRVLPLILGRVVEPVNRGNYVRDRLWIGDNLIPLCCIASFGTHG